MEQEKMTCDTCIFSKLSYERIFCNLYPTPIEVENDHWCGHGTWQMINEENGEIIDTYWGEWGEYV